MINSVLCENDTKFVNFLTIDQTNHVKFMSVIFLPFRVYKCLGHKMRIAPGLIAAVLGESKDYSGYKVLSTSWTDPAVSQDVFDFLERYMTSKSVFFNKLIYFNH